MKKPKALRNDSSSLLIRPSLNGWLIGVLLGTRRNKSHPRNQNAAGESFIVVVVVVTNGVPKKLLGWRAQLVNSVLVAWFYGINRQGGPYDFPANENVILPEFCVILREGLNFRDFLQRTGFFVTT